jgi:hypothetical protein
MGVMGKPGNARRGPGMLKIATYTSVFFLLSSCADSPGGPALKPNLIVRGFDSGARQIVDDYYSVTPDCENLGYPEIKILQAPAHGTVAVDKGEAFPSFAKDNVRYECNKKKVASSQLFYESRPGFHGKDSFTIQVRFVNSNLRMVTYNVDVL